jgi:hypothetical protein
MLPCQNKLKSAPDKYHIIILIHAQVQMLNKTKNDQKILSTGSPSYPQFII